MGDSLLEDEADIGAEVAFLVEAKVKFSCSYSMPVRLPLVERAKGGTLWDFTG